MANLTPWIRPQFFDNNGDPLASGKLYSYAAGTTTPLATYTTASGAVENANPVILDANGRAPVYLSQSSYKFVLKDSSDVTIWTEDNVSLPTVSNGFTTGDIKPTIKSTADSGWVLLNDTSIGNSASGASGRANDDTEELYILIWNNISNAYAAVTTGRGASAAADFAANKSMNLPRALGRVMAAAGAGSGLTSRALGLYLGAETHALSEAELATHTHTFTGSPHTHTQDAHTHSLKNGGGATAQLNASPAIGIAALDTGVAGYTENNSAGDDFVQEKVATNQNTTAGGTNSNTGSGTAHNNMQPTFFVNFMIKL
jgi:microcystin-dependent protein